MTQDKIDRAALSEQTPLISRRDASEIAYDAAIRYANGQVIDWEAEFSAQQAGTEEPPIGWKLVPTTPTSEMNCAGASELWTSSGGDFDAAESEISHTWSAMLNASPATPKAAPAAVSDEQIRAIKPVAYVNAPKLEKNAYNTGFRDALEAAIRFLALSSPPSVGEPTTSVERDL